MFKEKIEKKKMQDKVGSYAKYVKEMYWPQVSEQKRLQLESVKENIRHPIRRDNDDNTMYSAPGGIGQQEKKRSFVRHGTADNRVNYKQLKNKNVTSVRNLQNYTKDEIMSSHSSQNGQNDQKNNGFMSEPEMIDQKRKPQRRNIKPLA